MAGSGTSGLFGTPKQVAVERGLAEFRSGRPVIVTAGGVRVVPVGEAAPAAIELAKLPQLLPARLVADGSTAAVDVNEPPLVEVAAEAVAQFQRTAIASLAVVAETAIPLNGGIPARFVVFRD